MTTNTDALEALRDRWRSRWPDSLALWSRFTRLSEPRLCTTAEQAGEEGLTESFAMIRLVDQAVVVSLELITVYHLEDYALEVLGHEVGHHVLCPAELTSQGRMVARMRWALPGHEQLAPFLANLYADLLINDRLQRGSSLRMAEVYAHLGTGSEDRMWALYLRIYEVLWSLPTGSMATGPIDARLEADAGLGARLLRSYARRWLDGSGRFAALCLPYLEEDGGGEIQRIMGPWRDAEGTGGAVPAGLTEVEDGEREGAIHPALDPDLSGLSPTAGRPDGPGDGVPAGRATGQAREPFEYGQILRSLGLDLSDHDIAVRYYRERAAPLLIPFPSRPRPASTEPLPEGLEQWPLGAGLEDLDLVETVLRAPVVVPGITTVQRVWGTSEGSPPAPEPLDLDLYVDCSGSMPNPQAAGSPLALAGAVLALSCLRAGGRVQATLWSGAREYETTGGFVDDGEAVLRILTGYLGGATAFPIHLLRDTYADRRPDDRAVHVLVISDDGVTTMFDADERGGSGVDIAAGALAAARGGGTLVLNLWGSVLDARLVDAEAMGWVVERVSDWDAVVAVARRFARLTFGGDP